MNTENLKSEIKKIKLKHVALLCAGIFLAFSIIGTIFVVAGGGSLIKAEGFRWGNFQLNIGPGQLYDVNDRAELDMAGVTAVEISAISDNVTVSAGGEKAVAELKGQCRSANGPVYLDARRNGDKVVIEVKYPHGSSSGTTGLKVTVPASYRGNLSVTTVSGGIRANGTPFELTDVTLHSVSGDMVFRTASYRSLKATSISGDIEVYGIAAKTSAGSTSGSIELDYATAAETSVNTISGDVSAAIPGTAAFSVDFDSVSGNFRSTHTGLAVSKAKRGFTSIKEGAPLIKVNTTSGNFDIEGK